MQKVLSPVHHAVQPSHVSEVENTVTITKVSELENTDATKVFELENTVTKKIIIELKTTMVYRLSNLNKIIANCLFKIRLDALKSFISN